MAIKEEDAKNKLGESTEHAGLRSCERLKDFLLALWRERAVRERTKSIEFRNEDFR